MPNTVPGERNFGAFVPEELIDSFRRNVRDEGFKLKIVIQRLMEFWQTMTPDQQQVFYAGQFGLSRLTAADARQIVVSAEARPREPRKNRRGRHAG